MRSIFFGTILFFAVTIFSGDLAAAETTRIHTNLKGSRFNSALSEFSYGPTFVEYTQKKKKKNDHKSYLTVELELYPEDTSVSNVNKEARLWFRKGQSDLYLASIEKFLKWEKIAKSRGDQFTKDIGKHKATGGKIKFMFHSGTVKHHFLLLQQCTPAGCSANVAYFNVKNVKLLKGLLQKMQAGGFKASKVDDIYN